MCSRVYLACESLHQSRRVPDRKWDRRVAFATIITTARHTSTHRHAKVNRISIVLLASTFIVNVLDAHLLQPTPHPRQRRNRLPSRPRNSHNHFPTKNTLRGVSFGLLIRFSNFCSIKYYANIRTASQTLRVKRRK
jgi:hypothetical protein